jgi:alkanesulfonate monooxygenase SsuD/methylene tetrahydromethanopterin reductase-like flavin-dependent oxidoreductase (luciferase family)
MRFDFNPFFNPGENLPWNRITQMFRDQTGIAEESGFTTVWCTEHHFAHNGYLNAPPNPILMCADLGAHFSKIRLGQAPVVLPDWHPLRVAEDIALLDNMTEGRVDFGVGRGTNERGCIQFNLKADKRDTATNSALFRECLEIVIKAWTEDPFSHKGDFYEFPVPGWKETNRMFAPYDERYHLADGEYVGMYVHPRPYQQPHPPVWLMSNTPFTYEMAAAKGMNMVGMNSSTDNLKACWGAYQKGASSGQSKELNVGDGVCMCVVIYVADTMEQAARDIRPAINKYYEFVSGSRPLGEWGRESFLNEGEQLSNDEKEADWFDFLMARENIWVGTAEYVSEKIEQCQQELGLQHIMLLQQFPGVPIEKILASMTRFGEHVAPRFLPGD